MAKRFDVCSPRPRKDSDKPYWHRVGTAFQNDKGVNITFDSLPLPDKEGRVSVFLFEAKDKGASSNAATTSRGRDEIDDQIPFAAEFR